MHVYVCINVEKDMCVQIELNRLCCCSYIVLPYTIDTKTTTLLRFKNNCVIHRILRRLQIRLVILSGSYRYTYGNLEPYGQIISESLVQ